MMKRSSEELHRISKNFRNIVKPYQPHCLEGANGQFKIGKVIRSFMKVQYASDLHLEFEENRRLIESGGLLVAGDVLLLCGDTYTLQDKIDKHFELFLKWCSDNYQQTFLIPGNHEYYTGYPLEQHMCSFNEDIFPNVHFVNNMSVIFGNAEIFFTTLWTHIGQEDYYIVQKVMNDYRNILYQGKPLTPDVVNYCHVQSLEWLRNSLVQSSAQTKIIVTHHCPVDCKDVTSYVGRMAYPAYCVDMSSIISEFSPNFWIHGHTHTIATNNIVVKSTTVLTNPLGYVEDNENPSFNPGAFIEI